MKYYVLIAIPSDGFYGFPLAMDKIFTEKQVEEINRIAKEKYQSSFEGKYDSVLSAYVSLDLSLRDEARKRQWEDFTWQEVKLFEEVNGNAEIYV